jgi:hypothetical protein
MVDTLTRAGKAVSGTGRRSTQKRTAGGGVPVAGRGRRPSPLLDVRGELGERTRWLLAAAGLGAVVGLWI